MNRQELRLIAAGTMLIGVSYGLARFAYGLFLPSMRDDVGLSATLAGFIGSGAYVGYCLAIVASALLVERLGARAVAIVAALIAAGGMALIAASTQALWLAGAILLAGASTGLASPPMAQAVSGTIPASQQGRANTLINAGTSLGVAISGPVAFLATGQWRVAYAAFALTALINAGLLLVCVPRSGRTRHEHRGSAARRETTNGGLWRPQALSVVLAATGAGIASAAYWTFSSEAVVKLGHFDQATANIVWILIGVAGLVGGLAGDLVKRFGLNLVHRGALMAMALSLGLLASMPTSLAAVLVSGSLFGGAYIMLTGVYLVWGIRLYADRPAIGLGLPFLMLAVGQIIGSPLAGYLIGGFGYAFCFITFALIAVAMTIIGYTEKSHEAKAPSAPDRLRSVEDVAPAVSVPESSVLTIYLPAMPPIRAIERINRCCFRRLKSRRANRR